MARRLGDAETLAIVLDSSRLALARPDNARERLAMVREELDLAKQSRNQVIETGAHNPLAADLFELGDLVGARAAAARLNALAEELGMPFWRWIAAVHLAKIAFGEGRLEEGERLADQGFALGQQAGSEMALSAYGLQQFILRDLRGGLEVLEPAFKGSVEQYPMVPAMRSGLALLYRQLGWGEEAQGQFQVMAANDFADLPFDMTWITAMAILSDVCSFLDDQERAAILYERLIPYAELVVCVGEAATFGSAHRFLALLAATLERWPEFENHAAEALSRNAAMGLVSWTARTQYEVAAILARRRWQGDAERGRRLLEECLATCGRLGFGALAERAEVILSDLDSVDD
jgi:hypothetical protein